MYLSRVEIDYNNRKKISALTNLGAYHSWVEKMFPEEFTREERTRKLWRIDELKGKKYLLLVSETKPEKSIMNVYGVDESVQIKKYDEFISNRKNGEKMKFRATLNATVSKSSGKKSGKRGRVLPILSVEEQMKYFMRISTSNGFSVSFDEFFISESHMEKLKKNKEKPVSVNKVTYEGTLTITDIVLFKRALIGGIGRKKAYGCGMITVIPGQ